MRPSAQRPGERSISLPPRSLDGIALLSGSAGASSLQLLQGQRGASRCTVYPSQASVSPFAPGNAGPQCWGSRWEAGGRTLAVFPFPC